MDKVRKENTIFYEEKSDHKAEKEQVSVCCRIREKAYGDLRKLFWNRLFENRHGAKGFFVPSLKFFSRKAMQLCAVLFYAEACGYGTKASGKSRAHTAVQPFEKAGTVGIAGARRIGDRVYGYGRNFIGIRALAKKGRAFSAKGNDKKFHAFKQRFPA